MGITISVNLNTETISLKIARDSNNTLSANKKNLLEQVYLVEKLALAHRLNEGNIPYTMSQEEDDAFILDTEAVRALTIDELKNLCAPGYVQAFTTPRDEDACNEENIIFITYRHPALEKVKKIHIPSEFDLNAYSKVINSINSIKEENTHNTESNASHLYLSSPSRVTGTHFQHIEPEEESAENTFSIDEAYQRIENK